VDRKPVERGDARLAVGADRLRTAVGDPGASGPGHSALRDDPRALGTGGAERAYEQPLVAAGLVAVGMRGVEDGDPGLNRCGDRLIRVVGRKPHAAEPDADGGRVEPGAGQGASVSTTGRCPAERLR